MISRIKGTHDWLDLALYNFVVAKAKDHLHTYNFHEIATPLIEPTELFQRSLGEHTDVITKEMFMIVPHGDGEAMCLRPEATASVARAFNENGIQHTPWKVFTYGPMFRYERPQKGRYRQFHQIDMEIIGSDSIAQDVECIAMLDRFFHEKLQLNNYALALNFLGCQHDRAVYKEKLKAFLDTAGKGIICDNCLVRKEKNIMRVFDCKNPACQELYRKAPFIADALCSSCATEWQQVKEQLEMLSISYMYRPTLVRGLDYYTKTVFEFVSNDLGAQNAFCGGGRYDQLIRELGAKQDQPSIGAAIGIERLLLALESTRDTLLLPQLPSLHVIIPLTKEQHVLSLLLADTMRAQGLVVDVLLEGDSLKSMMRQANRLGATYAILLGSDEQEAKTAKLKNMITGHEEVVNQRELTDRLMLHVNAKKLHQL